jgi:NAD-dependent DNA ligase
MEIVSKTQNYSIKKMNKFCKEADIKDLHKIKLYLDDMYYNTEISIFYQKQKWLSDELYDIVKDTIIKRDPYYVPPVGAKIRDNENRVKIPYYMGSADKITPNEQKELDRWIDKNPCKELFISEKLDGVSGTFTVVNGKMNLFTRGDGEIGADISYLIQYIDSIPHLREDIAVRGELIIRKDVFKNKYYFDIKKDDCKDKGRGYGRLYRNARNMVSGLVGAKTVREGLRDIEFIVYEIVGNSTMPKPSNQIKTLKKLGFTTAMNKIISVPNNMDKWIDLHNIYKDKSKYEIDGIVVQSNIPYDRNTSGNPSYLFAFKVTRDDDIHETTVLDIEWSVSSWGNIVPVAIIDPVELPGNTIKRVTVSNAGMMREKGIGPGSIIKVTRSKEVIPFIVSVSERCGEFKWPDIEYEWDDNEVHLNVVNASPEIIAMMRVKVFSKFFDKMGIKHVSSATITKLYTHGFDTLLKIITANKEQLVEIDGIQEKSADRIVTNIKEGLKGVKAPILMSACGVFGFGVGQKRVIALMTDIPDLLTSKRNGLKKRILEVDGFSDIMADKVIDNIDYAIQFIDDISKHVSFLEDTRVSNELVGLKYVFSGFRSTDLEKDIEDRGGKITTSVSKKTSCMIIGSHSSKSTVKVLKAESLGIPVYTKKEFIEKFIS